MKFLGLTLAASLSLMAMGCGKMKMRARYNSIVNEANLSLQSAQNPHEAEHIADKALAEILKLTNGEKTEEANVCELLLSARIDDLFMLYSAVIKEEQGLDQQCRFKITEKVRNEVKTRADEFVKETTNEDGTKKIALELGLSEVEGKKVKNILPVGINPKEPWRRAGLKKGQVSLTFDDGPHSEFTPELLKILKAADVDATFFVLGQEAIKKKNAAALQQVHSAGHFIGSHSVSHYNVGFLEACQDSKGQDPKCPDQKALVENEMNPLWQIEASIEMILSVIPSMDSLFRFPYGAGGPKSSQHLRDLGLSEMFWVIDSLDWKTANPQKLLEFTVDEVKKQQDGAIILFHDIKPQTIAMMPAFLKALKEQGIKTFKHQGIKTLKADEVLAPVAQTSR